MEHISFPPEDLLQERRQVFRDFLELREHDHSFPFLVYGLADILQHQELPALLHGIGGLPQVLIRMVADLLQLHDGGEDDAAALDALHLIDHLLHVRHRFPVEDDLLPAQRHIVHALQLLRQIRDDFFVRLHPPEHEGRYHCLQSHVALRMLV